MWFGVYRVLQSVRRGIEMIAFFIKVRAVV